MAKQVNEITSLLDSATGPVAVTTTTWESFDIDDYVALCVKSKGEYLRLINKARTTNPQEVRNREPVNIEGINLGGFNAV
jgi:hypothetical protein